VRREALSGDAGGMPVHVLPNAIDAAAFARRARPGKFRRELGVEADRPLVLMVAQMVPWKGHRTFLEAFRLVRERCPEAVAVVAGTDLFGVHADYVAELRHEAARIAPADAVHFLGWRRDVATLMADCDVLALPSEREPFGRVFLEAMAMGTAVVSTASGGVPEVVSDGETGLLVPPGDARQLADALARLLEEPDLRSRLGECGRDVVRKRFSAAEHARRIGRLYDEVLNRWRR